ncbi:MAG: HD-GYP domain-containing protein [Myxococcota bacterium]
MRLPLALIVDDSALIRAHMTELAVQAGFRAVAAGDGAEAIEAISHLRPDVIVTDMYMPQLDGDEMIRRLRSLPAFRDTPILVVTSEESRQAKIELLRAGADEFLVKPVDPEEFQARLRALARRQKLALALTSMTAERDLALQRLEQRNRELEHLTLGLVAALERANSLNDDDTGNHIRRVCAYAAMLARARGCDERFVEEIGRYAGLHDVGKVGIRDAILKKPGQLTPEEYEEMKSHTLIGAELLRSAGLPPVAHNIARHHHERWDGSGYPDHLTGTSIPLEARIVAVVDVFDALVTKRVYKPAFALDEARRMMTAAAGAHLDPSLVELFFSRMDDVLRIASAMADRAPEPRPSPTPG